MSRGGTHTSLRGHAVRAVQSRPDDEAARTEEMFRTAGLRQVLTEPESESEDESDQLVRLRVEKPRVTFGCRTWSCGARDPRRGVVLPSPASGKKTFVSVEVPHHFE